MPVVSKAMSLSKWKSVPEGTGLNPPEYVVSKPKERLTPELVALTGAGFTAPFAVTELTVAPAVDGSATSPS